MNTSLSLFVLFHLVPAALDARPGGAEVISRFIEDSAVTSNFRHIKTISCTINWFISKNNMQMNQLMTNDHELEPCSKASAGLSLMCIMLMDLCLDVVRQRRLWKKSKIAVMMVMMMRVEALSSFRHAVASRWGVSAPSWHPGLQR